MYCSYKAMDGKLSECLGVHVNVGQGCVMPPRVTRRVEKINKCNILKEMKHKSSKKGCQFTSLFEGM